MWQTKFHTPVKQEAKIIFLYVLIFIGFDSKLEEKRFWTE